MGETARAGAEPLSDVAPSLTYLGPSSAPIVVVRRPPAARRLADEHAYLVDRVADRLAACWPQGVDRARLMAEGRAALLHVATTVEDPGEIGACAVGEIAGRMRHVLAAGEWYRQVMLGRVRPLTDLWRGLVLSGRTPTDECLCRRLRLGPRSLAERFVEFAVVFAVEPRAPLPSGMDAKYAVGELVASLPGAQQLAVALYYHQELTFPEVARVMGLEPRQTQELFGRATAAVTGEAGLPVWRAPALSA